MDKTVVITGSSRGIGKETVRFFAERGWNVAATMRNTESCSEFSELENVKLYELDVKDNDSILNTRDQIIDDFGKVDVIVNNAGKGLFGVFEASTIGQIIDQYETNLFGAMNVIKAFLPHLRENRQGTIINVTSMAGLEPNPLISLYNSSKFALDAFSEALSYELGQLGIRVKIIVPGSTKSDFMSPQSMVWTNSSGLEDYKLIIEKFTSFAQKMTDPGLVMEAVEVSELIYKAATDGLNKVRYIVGERNQQRFERRIANGLEGIEKTIEQLTNFAFT